MTEMPREFSKSWKNLNKRLQAVERRHGLGGAAEALLEHQRQSGFIKDAPEDIERRRFDHPGDPSRFFRVQYNPKRAKRFSGAGQLRRPSQTPILNDGCYLCRENVKWQQQGKQLGYEIRVGSSAFNMLANPFPLLPGHLVIASAAHRSQDWFFQDIGRLNVDGLLGDLIELADRMPGHIGFYNGVSAGASIPGHLHYQFCQRPQSDPPQSDPPQSDPLFPLELAARKAARANGEAVLAEGYPLQVISWKGRAGDILASASDWIAQWSAKNEARLNGLSANFIVTRNIGDDDIWLYFAPRDRDRPRAKGLSGLCGGLEVLGEIVLSSPEEKMMLDGGQIDFFSLERALASINTPFFTD